MSWSSTTDPLAARIVRFEVVDSGLVRSTIGERPGPDSFEALVRAYRRFGGLKTGHDLSQQLLLRHGAGARGLAGRIAAGEMFGWVWQDDFWVPMFQVDRDSLAVRPGSRRVLSELRGVFDGWSLAQWFVHPNTWLRGRRPLDLLSARPAAVLLAARGDRVIAGA